MQIKPESIGAVNSAEHYCRPRLQSVLEKAAGNFIVYAFGGTGYGKTQAIRTFIESLEGVCVFWMQMTENDNIPFAFWENFCYSLSKEFPALAEELRAVGFPNTDSKFKRFVTMIRENLSLNSPERTFVVYDDFHIITDERIVNFFERMSNFKHLRLCSIAISHSPPPPFLLSKLSKEGLLSILDEDVFRFTRSEIEGFMRQEGLTLTDIDAVLEETKGWAMAIRLLAIALKHARYGEAEALRAVKENIFNFMEKEIFEYSDNEDQKTMVKLSLINRLPPPVQTAITDDMRFLRNNPNLSSLVWYDSFAGDYRMHPIYIEFLQGKQDMLSEEEIRAVYVHAAEWCIHNNFELEAFCFYAKLKNWGAMVQIAVRHMYTIPKSAAEVFVETFDSICGEQDDEYGHLALLCDALTPSFLIILGRNAEAEERTVKAIKKWENSKAPYIPILMFTFYNNLGFLGVYGCPKTHRYDFYKYFKYATEEFYYKINTAGAAPIEMPPSSAILGSYACMVGVGVDKAEIRQFLGAIKETMKYLPLTFNGYYYGYDDFAEAELAYFSSRTGDAKRFALRAIEKAREKKQFEIEAGALMLLLRCAVFEGDYARLSWLLTQLRAMLGNKHFPNRQMFYDLATGWLGAQIGVPSLISSWFTSNDDGNDKSSYKLYKEWAVKLLCLLKNRRYEEILLFEFTADEESSALLFGFISVNLLKAIASLRSGYLEHAVQLLETVYDNSLNGELQMPFIAHGSDMKELAALALKSKSKIPKAWLDSVALKASAYAKKTASIAAMYNKDNGIQESISLTEREIQVLNDLYLGLSRQEIAASRFLSINTVKTIIQTLYVKLGAESNIDAVRIALERKLIGI